MVLNPRHSPRCGLLTTVCATTVYRSVLRHTPDLIGEKPVLTRNIYSSILCSLAEERDCISPVQSVFAQIGRRDTKASGQSRFAQWSRRSRTTPPNSLRSHPSLLHRRQKPGHYLQHKYRSTNCCGPIARTACMVPNTPHIGSWKQALSSRMKTTIDYLLTSSQNGGSRVLSRKLGGISSVAAGD